MTNNVTSDITELLSIKEKYFIYKYRDNICEQPVRTQQLQYCMG